MGLLDKIKGELVDIVEWLDDTRDTIVWRFPRYENEIKMGAQLVVRESQTAVFVNEGLIADVFEPGTYTLETQNLPVLSTLKGWKYGFHSPFKAEVYFVSTRQFTDLKWGTKNPVMMRDPELGMVRLRAFGAFAARVTDPQKLLRELVGTDPQFRTDEVHEYLRQNVVSHLASALASAGIPVIDLAAHHAALGTQLATKLTDELAELGISVPNFVIENISLPPEVEEALDKRTSMGIVSSGTVGSMAAFQQFQAGAAMEAAADGGGSAGAVIGMGLGQSVGNAIVPPTQTAPAPTQTAPASGPPPLPGWYLGNGGAQTGPFDDAALAAQAAAGTLTAGTLIWRAGMSAWEPASSVPDVARHLGATPPPLPQA
ncbi:Membrane protease subunit, stomatin/prohibitin family, contains C-terminal Zn-ribbon domain [Promicromonospora umidemergens]|uniref:SPFH domain-containing protein n=1 Tax=Promicromonospora umidemergens TaxID=629679 RepID=A0ABP8Y8U8_9MICO|nr:SPFH domain-containing protein [Promicromonospora umidemergens]MCP2282347.1 Membrane protease subunit, stomatin/prohibitin family, contains C-terminal Zn-ribbon domain [Promicromonospora umidemergens]